MQILEGHRIFIATLSARYYFLNLFRLKLVSLGVWIITGGAVFDDVSISNDVGGYINAVRYDRRQMCGGERAN